MKTMEKHTAIYFPTRTQAQEYIVEHNIKNYAPRWLPKSGDAWVVREIEDEPKPNPFRVIKGGIE
jgi:hypothetical protein